MIETDREQAAQTCRICGMATISPAAAFLHREAHAEEFGGLGLNKLPFSLFGRVEKLMQDYADAVMRMEV
jgi:hypothetical protein